MSSTSYTPSSQEGIPRTVHSHSQNSTLFAHDDDDHGSVLTGFDDNELVPPLPPVPVPPAAPAPAPPAPAAPSPLAQHPVPAPNQAAASPALLQPSFPLGPPTDQDYENFLRCQAHHVIVEATKQFNRTIAMVNSGQFVCQPVGQALPNFYTPTTSLPPVPTVPAATAPPVTTVHPTQHQHQSTSARNDPVAAAPSDAAPNEAVHESPDSDDREWFWPDGDVVYSYPVDCLNPNGIFQFGWRMCQNDTQKNKSGIHRRKYFCVGVHRCPTPDCKVVDAPLKPTKQSLGSAPPPTEAVCPIHKQTLVWERCTGGNQSANPRSTMTDPPCTLWVETNIHSGEITVQHHGTHNHLRPPAKLDERSRKKAKDLIKSHPEVTPAQLLMGGLGRPPIDSIHPALVNKDKVKGLRDAVLNEFQNKGLRGGIASFLEWHKDLPQPDSNNFVKKMELLDTERQIITLQSGYMRDALLECGSALNVDTVEGCGFDSEFSGKYYVQMASIFDERINRWVPVLISIIFGKSRKHYKSHFESLFQSYGPEVNQSWESFTDFYTGATMDWSSALGQGYIDALMDHAIELGETGLTREDLQSFSRKCEVHFMRSVRRIENNGNAVPAHMQRDFRRYIDNMRDPDCSFRAFVKITITIGKKFPNTIPWLKFHMLDQHVQQFFPAVQNFDQEAFERHAKLLKTTNPQESVNKCFQMAFDMKKMSIYEVMDNSWKFQNRFAMNLDAVKAGQSLSYQKFPPKKPPPKRPKDKKSDVGPESNRALGINQGSRRSAQTLQPPFFEKPMTLQEQMAQEKTLFELYKEKCLGPRWNISPLAKNTCPLDSMLAAFHLPHHGKALLQPHPDLDDNSLFSLTIRLADQHRWEEARMLWLNDSGLYPNFDPQHPAPWHETFGDSLFFYEKFTCQDGSNLPLPMVRERKLSTWKHPLEKILQFTCFKTLQCHREGGCRKDDPSLNFKEATLDQTDGTDNDQVGAVYNKRKIFQPMHFWLMDDMDSPKDALESFINKKINMEKKSCLVEWWDPDSNEHKSCEGPSAWVNPEIEGWPPMLAFRMTHGKWSLNTAPLVFFSNGHSFILRAAIIHKYIHFGVAIRAPKAWMHQDGLWPPGVKDCYAPRCKFYPLSEGIQAQDNGVVDTFLYEVVLGKTVDENNPAELFGDPNVDWGDLFVASNSCLNPAEPVTIAIDDDGDDDDDDDDDNKKDDDSGGTSKRGRPEDEESVGHADLSSGCSDDSVVAVTNKILEKHKTDDKSSIMDKIHKKSDSSDEEDWDEKVRAMNVDEVDAMLDENDAVQALLGLSSSPQKEQAGTVEVATPVVKEEPESKSKPKAKSKHKPKKKSFVLAVLADVRKELTGMHKEHKKGIKQEPKSPKKPSAKKKAKPKSAGKKKTPESKKRKAGATKVTMGKRQPRKKPKTPDGSQRKKRDKMGFYFRGFHSGKGKKPTCPGCEKEVDPHDDAVKHGFKMNAGDDYVTTKTYHCHHQCLIQLEEHHLLKFLQKRWTDPEVMDVVNEINRIRGKKYSY